MESTPGVFDHPLEDIDVYLHGTGMVAPATADLSITSPTVTNLSGGSGDAVSSGGAASTGAATAGRDRGWHGREMSAANTLVVLVTTMCRRGPCLDRLWITLALQTSLAFGDKGSVFGAHSTIGCLSRFSSWKGTGTPAAHICGVHSSFVSYHIVFFLCVGRC